jgi:hypothetical protein
MTGIGDFQLKAVSVKNHPHLGAGRPRMPTMASAATINSPLT